MPKKDFFMQTLKRQILLLGGLIILLISGIWLQASQPKELVASKQTNTAKPATKAGYLAYKGQNGVTALALLKKQAQIEQEKSGLIVSINKKKADATTQTYWAFYVNGKLAEVGPADYVTKDTDRIEWKVEKY
jgi:hypothetical protein